jgi:hypothetical protein
LLCLCFSVVILRFLLSSFALGGGSAFAFALSLPLPLQLLLPLPLPLPLPLQVCVVILSGAKNPEKANSATTLRTFQPTPLPPLPLPFAVAPLLLPLPFAFRRRRCCAVAVEIERGFSPASRPAAKRLPPYWSQATHLIAFAVACFYFSCFPPKNRMSSPQTT